MPSAKKILIIDDEPDIREIAKISLQLTQKWEILTAASGAEGVAMAITHHPDAILLDVVMPHMSGLETLKKLKAHAPTAAIPVLLLTATSKLATQADYLQSGAQGILIKPFDPGIIGQQIATSLGWEPHPEM